MTFVETTYTRGQRIPQHSHERPYFCFVIEGTYDERSGASSVACGAGTVVFHPRDAIHGDEFGDAGGRCFNVECETGWLSELNTDIDSLTGPLYLRDPHAIWLMHGLYREIAINDRHAGLAAEGLTRAVVAAAGRVAAASVRTLEGPSWFLQVVEMARQEYATGLTLSEAAGRVGVHPRRLARAFRRHLGCSVGQFVRRVRIEAACRLLADPRLSLSSVALRTGFADQSHFTRTFRRDFGVTPSQYRDCVQPRPSRSSSSE